MKVIENHWKFDESLWQKISDLEIPVRGQSRRLDGHWMWFHSIDSAMVGSLKNLGDAPEKGTWLTRTPLIRVLPCWIAQFAITINSNVCPHIRVPNMLMRESYADVIGIRWNQQLPWMATFTLLEYLKITHKTLTTNIVTLLLDIVQRHLLIFIRTSTTTGNPLKMHISSQVRVMQIQLYG